jgi:hypothetical protein
MRDQIFPQGVGESGSPDFSISEEKKSGLPTSSPPRLRKRLTSTTTVRTVACAVLLAACSRGAPVAGESVKLRAGERAPSRSAIWVDGRVELRGARGEVLGLQVLAPHRRARLELDPRACAVDGFSVAALTVREPSTDMYGPSRGPGAYPDVLTPQTGDVPAPAYFDVAIARDAPPGRYSGRLWLDDRALPVELRVEPVTIDLRRDPLVWVFYLPREIARVHGLADDDSAAELAWERRYAELFRAHGCFLASDLPPARQAPRRDLAAGLRYWPVGLDEQKISEQVQEILNMFKVGSTAPFAILLDEPHTPEERARVRRLGDEVARAGGGAPRLLRAVTAARSLDYDDAVDVWLSPDLFAAGARPPDGKRFWTYNGKPPKAGSMILDTDGTALRSWGWIAFRYDVELWHAWEGLYFSDRYNRGGPTDVLRDPDTFDERRKGGRDHGNGDGVLAYPGPLPSLRLKALRRGLEDRLLLERLVECGHGDDARAIARRLVPRALGDGRGDAAWPRDEGAFEAARGELYDRLAASCADIMGRDAPR